jgi:hypothetical protein
MEMDHVLKTRDTCDLDGNKESGETSQVDESTAAIEADDTEMDHVLAEKDETGMEGTPGCSEPERTLWKTRTTRHGRQISAAAVEADCDAEDHVPTRTT